MKSLSILSSASRAIRPRYEIPNSVEPEGACASSRNDQTSSYLRAPSCLAKRGGRGAEGCRGEQKEEWDRGVSATPIRTLAGLNGPRLIRHKRLILKNSGRDKLFGGATDFPSPFAPNHPGSYGAPERSRLSRRSSFH